MSLADDIVKEIINEGYLVTEGTVYKGYGICLVAAPDKGRNYDEDAYFKMYGSESLKNPKYVYRIKFKSPELIVSHKNDPHGATSRNSIDSKYRKILINSLEVINTNGDTIWVSLIKEFNKYVPDNYKLPIDLEIPDYNNLK